MLEPLLTTGSLLLLYLSIVLSAIIIIVRFFPRILTYQTLPLTLKHLVTKLDNSLLKSYGFTYSITFVTLMSFWYSAIYWFYGWLTKMTPPANDVLVFSILAVLVLTLGSYLVASFFIMHVNIKLLQRTKNNQKKYLPYVLRFFIQWGEQLYSFGSLAFAFLMYWVLFIIFGWSLLGAYWNAMLIVTFGWVLVATLCLIAGKILTIEWQTKKFWYCY